MTESRLAVAALVGLLPSLVSRLPAQDTTRGKVVYVKWCAGCHGDDGAGDGPAAAYMLPRPRNFTGGLFKNRTPAHGQLPPDPALAPAIHLRRPRSASPGTLGLT